MPVRQIVGIWFTPMKWVWICTFISMGLQFYQHFRSRLNGSHGCSLCLCDGSVTLAPGVVTLRRAPVSSWRGTEGAWVRSSCSSAVPERARLRGRAASVNVLLSPPANIRKASACSAERTAAWSGVGTWQTAPAWVNSTLAVLFYDRMTRARMMERCCSKNQNSYTSHLVFIIRPVLGIEQNSPDVGFNYSNFIHLLTVWPDTTQWHTCFMFQSCVSLGCLCHFSCFSLSFHRILLVINTFLQFWFMFCPKKAVPAKLIVP